MGKTTTKLNVAAGQSVLGREPLILEHDPQAHVSLALGVLSLNAPFAAEQVLIPVTADFLTIQPRNRS